MSVIFVLERLVFVFGSQSFFINSSSDLFSQSLIPLSFATSFNTLMLVLTFLYYKKKQKIFL